MPINLKLRQLEGFVLAADEKSFVRAASALAMTPPAFSQLIREFENTIGVPLFERTTRSVQLTEVGEKLLLLVRRPLEDIAEVQGWLRDVRSGRRGKITFASLHSVAFGIGTESIATFARHRPDVEVQLIEDKNESLIEKVLNRQVDFGLGMFTKTLSGLSFEALLEDDLVAVMPRKHAISHISPISWAELAAVPLILLQQGSSVRSLVEAGLLVANAPREKTTEVVSMVTALQMVSAGLGVTVVPSLSLGSLRMKGLVARPIGPPKPTRTVGILMLAGRPPTPAGAAFLSILRNVSAKLQSEFSVR